MTRQRRAFVWRRCTVSKGFEFGVVIIAAYKGAANYAELFARDEDAGVSDETATAERSPIHVAATRAKRHLFLLERPEN
jgi:hypothetical protein